MKNFSDAEWLPDELLVRINDFYHAGWAKVEKRFFDTRYHMAKCAEYRGDGYVVWCSVSDRNRGIYAMFAAMLERTDWEIERRMRAEFGFDDPKLGHYKAPTDCDEMDRWAAQYRPSQQEPAMEETRGMTNPERPLDVDSSSATEGCECDGCKAVRYIERVLGHIEEWWPQPVEPVSMGPGYSEWEDTSEYEREMEGHPVMLLSHVLEEIIYDAHGLIGLYGDDIDMHEPGPERAETPDGLGAEGIVEGLRAGYPDASAEELMDIAQTTVAEYGGGDALYDAVCQILKAQ